MLDAMEIFGVSLLTLILARALSVDISVKVNPCECYLPEEEGEEGEEENWEPYSQ